MLSTEKILSRLSDIEWHDLPVESITFATGESTDFIISFLLYNELKEGHDKFTLVFKGIEELEAENLIFTHKSDLEIYGFNYDFKDFFVCELILLLGFGEPGLNIHLRCKSIDLYQKND